MEDTKSYLCDDVYMEIHKVIDKVAYLPKKEETPFLAGMFFFVIN